MNSCVYLASALLFVAVPSLRAADANEIVSPAHKITPGQTDSEWTPLFNELSRRQSITADFTENRYLPFKKIPVVFKGEIRFSRERGLSLHYKDPDENIVIVDSKGMLVRDSRGRPHEFSDARAQATIIPLLNILRFDQAELSKSFDVYGVKNGEDWTLAFDPRAGDLANNLNRLVVSGHEKVVRKIEMRKSALVSVQILIENVRIDANFTPEEASHFFR